MMIMVITSYNSFNRPYNSLIILIMIIEIILL